MNPLIRRIGLIAAVTIGAACLQTPAYAETLRVSLPANLTSLDPHKGKTGEEYALTYMIYSGLTEIDTRLSVKPDLAESWETSDDLKSWTFHLRKGVKFHNGKELDSGDVVASINRILDPAIGSVSRTNLSIVSSVEAIDPLTVKFELSIPYAPFAELLADRSTKIVQKDSIDTLATEPVGTGPFKFVSYKAGDRVELVKNDDYYQSSKPILDNVQLRIIPESAAQQAAIRNGEIDLVWNVGLETLPAFADNKDIVVKTVATAAWDGLIMDNSKPPFDNILVRQAVAAMVDKKLLVELAIFGNGAASHVMIQPDHPGFAKDIPFNAPDPIRAKALLAQAGFPDGFEIPLYVPGERPNRERAAVALREMLRPAGIRVNLQRVTFQKFLSDIEGKAEFYVSGFLGRPNADTALFPFFHSDGSWNTSLWHYKSDRVDELLEKSRAARNADDQNAAYRDIQKVITEEAPGVIFYVINHANALRANVKGFQPSPLTLLDLRDVTIE